MKGLGHAPGEPQSVSLDESYHNEQQYIWFKVFYEVKGLGHAPGEPQSVSFDESYHNE